MSDAPLRGDCARCAALCCVAPAFDRSAYFGFDKAAGVPCVNLDGACRCKIHERLEESGFGGCAAYDCYGAGQVVTQQMFGGRSWRDDPDLLEPMMEAFGVLRRVHELRFLLEAARKLPLNADQLHRIAGLEAGLGPEGGWTTSTLSDFDVGNLAGETRTFLRGLKEAAGTSLGR